MRYADSSCICQETYDPHVYTFIGPCIVTGKQVSVTVPADGLYRYRQGELIQTAFPTLSAEDREFLISGMSAEGWEKTFGVDEDDED